jgi:hypothetical protein
MVTRRGSAPALDQRQDHGHRGAPKCSSSKRSSTTSSTTATSSIIPTDWPGNRPCRNPLLEMTFQNRGKSRLSACGNHHANMTGLAQCWTGTKPMSTKKPKRAALYLRVSTDGQGTENQRLALVDW